MSQQLYNVQAETKVHDNKQKTSAIVLSQTSRVMYASIYIFTFLYVYMKYIFTLQPLFLYDESPILNLNPHYLFMPLDNGNYNCLPSIIHLNDNYGCRYGLYFYFQPCSRGDKHGIASEVFWHKDTEDTLRLITTFVLSIVHRRSSLIYNRIFTYCG